MTRVVVVDDEPMVCAHLRTILTAAGLEVVGEARDGAGAVEAAGRLAPDVMLIDLRMPGVDGLTAIERIATLRRPPRMVALTTFDLDEYVLRALRAGAVGFLVKSTSPEDLADMVRVAAAGNTVLSPVAAQRLIGSAGPARRAREICAGLTDREREVLESLAAGWPNHRIGRRLHLSEATVKGYVSRLMIKLDCANRTEVALLAQAAGLAVPPGAATAGPPDLT
jgi:DNA-binding NarL/FixJ family response regulator